MQSTLPQRFEEGGVRVIFPMDKLRFSEEVTCSRAGQWWSQDSEAKSLWTNQSVLLELHRASGSYGNCNSPLEETSVEITAVPQTAKN